MPRHVRGLQKAQLMAEGPFKGPRPVPKGRAAEGLRFQAKAHEELALQLGPEADLLSEPWIRFADTYGTHWCQPDSVARCHDRTVVIEAKLSLRQLDTALVQLRKLYKPVLEALFGKPVVMLVAFKHFLGPAEGLKPLEDPKELLTLPLPAAKEPFGWHFLSA